MIKLFAQEIGIIVGLVVFLVVVYSWVYIFQRLIGAAERVLTTRRNPSPIAKDTPTKEKREDHGVINSEMSEAYRQTRLLDSIPPGTDPWDFVLEWSKDDLVDSARHLTQDELKAMRKHLIEIEAYEQLDWIKDL